MSSCCEKMSEEEGLTMDKKYKIAVARICRSFHRDFVKPTS